MATRELIVGVAKISATASPLPLAGEGQGEGMHQNSRKDALSPPLPRKRGREQTERIETPAPSTIGTIEGAA